MRKQALFVGVMALSTAGLASANGFYVGGGIGGLDLNQKTTQTQTIAQPPVAQGYGVEVLAPNTTTTQNGGKLGVNGTVMAGYSWSFSNRMYLGLESFYNYSSAKVSANGTSSSRNTDAVEETTSDLRLNYVYGARVLPGYQVTPDAVVYGILGVARGNFRASGTANAYLYGSEPVDGSATGSQNFNLNAYQLGFGAMIDMSEHVALRGDVIYSGYQSKTLEATNTATQATTTYEIVPSTVEANIVMVYKFG